MHKTMQNVEIEVV